MTYSDLILKIIAERSGLEKRTGYREACQKQRLSGQEFMVECSKIQMIIDGERLLTNE